MTKPRNVFAAALIAAGGAVAAFALPVGIAAGIDASIHPAHAACDPGTKIDKTTANDARAKITKAGYSKVRDLKKGCDNYWHGIATKDGQDTRVVVSPSGEVMTEGD
jgi:hypothetical protein